MSIGLGLSLALGRGGVAPFNAAQVPGLVAYWDFSDASTIYTDSGTTLVTSNADVVGQVNDKSGNGHHLRQTDGTAKPTYRTNQLNGRPVVRFDGVNDHLDCISAASAFQFLHESVNTIYIVIKAGLVADPNAFMAILDNLTLAGSVGSRYGVRLAYDDRASVPVNEAIRGLRRGGTTDTANALTANAFLAAQTFGVLSFVSDPTNATAANRSYIRKNGGAASQTNAATGAVGSTAPTYALSIGAAAGDAGFPFAGDLGPVLVYNQNHGTTDRQYVENGLMALGAIS